MRITRLPSQAGRWLLNQNILDVRLEQFEGFLGVAFFWGQGGVRVVLRFVEGEFGDQAGEDSSPCLIRTP